MGRPCKRGLDYFPLDVNFFDNQKIKTLRNRFGMDAVAFLLMIYAECYRDKGYYLEYTEDTLANWCFEMQWSEEKTEQIMQHLTSRELLIKVDPGEDNRPSDGESAGVRVTYITARSIASQYQISTKGLKREVPVNPTIWPLKKEETLGHIKVTLFSENQGKTQVNPGKTKVNPRTTRQNKRNENKRNNKSECGCSAPPKEQELTLGDFGKVHLTQKQVDTIKREHPGYFDEAVKILDEYKESTGKTYKSDLAAMSSWVYNAVDERRAKRENLKNAAKGLQSANKNGLRPENMRTYDETRQYEFDPLTGDDDE